MPQSWLEEKQESENTFRFVNFSSFPSQWLREWPGFLVICLTLVHSTKRQMQPGSIFPHSANIWVGMNGSSNKVVRLQQTACNEHGEATRHNSDKSSHQTVLNLAACGILSGICTVDRWRPAWWVCWLHKCRLQKQWSFDPSPLTPAMHGGRNNVKYRTYHYEYKTWSD